MWYMQRYRPLGRARHISDAGRFSNLSEWMTRVTGTSARRLPNDNAPEFRIVMTETKNPGEKTLTVTPTKTLTLKRSVEQGVVRQSFSHGRTKAVVVEKVKRRTVGRGDAKIVEPAPVAAAPASVPRRGAAAPAARGASAGATAASAAPAAAPSVPGGKPSGVVLRQLTEEERS